MSYVDLHTHSTASDGTYKPSALIDLAIDKGLSAIALTDHDTTAGIDEFLDYGKQHADKIDVVPGVEISVLLFGAEVHIAGLFIDHTNKRLNSLLETIRSNRDKRNNLLIEKLRGLGYDITLEEVKEVAKGESIGRPHLSRVLIDKGYFSSVEETFEKCLARGCPAYCERILPSEKETVEVIHEAGGLAIWAHPLYRRKDDRSYIEKTLKVLLDAGIDGVEIYYTTFTESQQALIREFAENFGLLYSGGTDFHGTIKPDIKIGTGFGNMYIPETIYLDLKDAWEKRYKK